MGFVRPSAMAAGLLVGLAAVGASVPHPRMAGGEGSLGLDLRVSATVPGELALGGDDLIVNARRIVPGRRKHDETGHATVTNQTGVPLDVRVVAIPSSPQLADRIMMSLRSDGRTLARGTLAELHRGTAAFHIRRGGRRRISARVWIPASVRDGYAGVLQDVSLELRAAPAPVAKKDAA